MSPGMDHHVYFWLKEENQNPADRARFEEGLAALLEIDEVVGGRWAVPAKLAPRPVLDQSWDYALAVQFDSIEKHDAYQVAPAHLQFLANFKDWWKQVQVKDLA